jgi:hypothetical protein
MASVRTGLTIPDHIADKWIAGRVRVKQPGGCGPHFFARINARSLAPGTQGRKQNIYRCLEAASLRGRRHCEQNIYKTHKAASLAGRKAELMTGICKAPKKMCKYLAKFAKINATVKQLAVNKRDTI